MGKKRFLIEFGTGVDIHGYDMTKAALRAIKDAISHCCMVGINEIHQKGAKNISLQVKLFCPKPDLLNLEALKEPLYFYDDVEFIPLTGGASAQGLYVPEMGEGDTLAIVNAVITVFLEV